MRRPGWQRTVLLGLALGLALGTAVGAASSRDSSVDPISIIRSGLPHDALYDIEFAGSTGIAVGHYGTVLSSSDGGVTWTQAQTPGDAALTAVALGPDRTIVVGQKGAIFVRDNDGSFEAVESPTAERLLSVAMNDAGLAVAVGGFGTVLVSGDGGRTWDQVVLDWEALNDEGLEAHLYDTVVTADGVVFVVGEFGLVLRSSDRGQTWERLTSGDASLFALHLADGVGYAVGQDGAVLRSADGGSTWETVDVGTRANLLGVWASQEGEVVIVGMRALVRSSDGGGRWHLASGRSVERSWYQAVTAGIVVETREKSSIREQRVYAVGQMGNIVTVNW